MSKVIPAALLSHKALPTTTLCRLLKVKCKNGTLFGFANLDTDITYNDNSGDGAIVYKSANGFTPMRLSAAAGTSVDNTDLAGVVADLSAYGITEQQIRSGILDYANAYVYEVNYNDLTTGRHETKARGNCGNVTNSGEEFRAEFRSLTQRYKQPLGKVTSITCRAQFGDTQCGKPLTWVAGTVTAVSGTEPDRIFTASALTQAASYFVPGVVEWLTGNNAGLQVEVETFAAGVVSISLPSFFSVAIGDTFRIRQDCTKVWADATHGCLYHWGTARPSHFRGEPLIPLGQEGALGTPGAEI